MVVWIWLMDNPIDTTLQVSLVRHICHALPKNRIELIMANDACRFPPIFEADQLNDDGVPAGGLPGHGLAVPGIAEVLDLIPELVSECVDGRVLVLWIVSSCRNSTERRRSP